MTLPLALAGGCSSTSSLPNFEKPVVSRLTPQAVKQIATARAAQNGFRLNNADSWQVTLSVGDQGLKWIALSYPTPGSPAAWVEINDATSQAEFVAPEIRIEQKFAEDSDWLVQIDDALRKTTFPIEMEAFMRAAHFAGASLSGGGGTPDGRSYLEYTLRPDVAMPARFEIRCYYREDAGPGPNRKMATGAELAYVDAQTFRYLLVRSQTP